MARAAPSFSQTVTRDNTVDLLGVHGMRASTQQYLTQQEEDEPDVSHAPSRITFGASSRFRPLRTFVGPSKRHRLPLEVVMASGMYDAFAPRNTVSRYHRLWKAHKWYAERALVTKRSKAHLMVRLRRRLKT
jgi:hypothetical protein